MRDTEEQLELPRRVRLRRAPRLRPFLGRFATVSVAIVGTAAAILAFVPRVTVAPVAQTIEEGDDGLHFRISNQTYIPLYNVRIVFGLCEVRTDGIEDHGTCSGSLQSRLVPAKWQTKELYIDDTKTVYLGDLFENASSLTTADFSIHVEGDPAGLSIFRIDREFKFLLRRLRDGKRHWEQRPASE